MFCLYLCLGENKNAKSGFGERNDGLMSSHRYRVVGHIISQSWFHWGIHHSCGTMHHQYFRRTLLRARHQTDKV